MALHHEKRRERVAAAFERGETEANSSAQHHAVAGMEGMDAPGDSDNEQCLDELLDQAHLEVRQGPVPKK